MKALVVGYGSIGARHATVLRELGCDVAVLSSRAVDFAPLFHDIDAALDTYRPDYVVVANHTSDHFDTLVQLAEYGYAGLLLVEKPLFDEARAFMVNRFKAAYVGYNLRFHPLVEKLRAMICDEKLVSVQMHVGQYLPSWRPGTDYRQSYSASADAGGGVLRDLSHEIDLAAWLFGKWDRLTAIGGTFGDLGISSDDTFALLFSTDRCPVVTVQMNYLDRHGKRELLVNTVGNTYHLDLLGGRLVYREGEERVQMERNDTYLKMHMAAIGGPREDLCSIQEGMDVMNTIVAAEKASKTFSWVSCGSIQ